VEEALAYAPSAEAAFVDLGWRMGITAVNLQTPHRPVWDQGHPDGKPPDKVGYGRERAVDVIGKPFMDERILERLKKAIAKPG